jgi:hypothetical protein
MKPENENTIKSPYISPQIESVRLENEISLALESMPSLPPFGPDETVSDLPDYFNNDPFKNNHG